MARYIDADKIEYIKAPLAPLIKGDVISWQDIVFKGDIDNIPTADVQEVRHGKWVQVEENKCRCPNCDIVALIALYPHGDKNYCPNCGAKMDMECENDKL